MRHRFKSSRSSNSLSESLKLIGFFVILIGATPCLSKSCLSAQTQFQRRFETLQNDTLNRFNEKISNPDNFPIWTNGFGKNKNEIVYLLHGFIGSPFEMRSTAQSFLNQGYTVILDLLPGHGLSARASNQFTKAALKKYVFKNLDDITSCASRVHVIGFSTGSTVLHHYLQTKSPASVKSVSFISPYYRPTIAFGDLLSQGSALFISTLSVDFAYSVSRFPDIKVAFLDTDHYHRDIPLNMALEINSLGEETYLTEARIQIPLLVLTSSHDKIASPLATSYKISQDFSAAQRVHFNSFYFAPHHLMADSVSPVSAFVHQSIADFIQKNSK